jgi:hypothetical protein
MTDNIHEGWHGRPPALRGLRIAGMVVLGVIGACAFALAFGWVVMLLWNWLMPAIFGLGTIGYWQAFGLVVLAKLLFGRMGGPHGGPKHRPPWKGGPWEKYGDHGHSREDWKWFRDFWEREGRAQFEHFRDGMKAARESAREAPPQGGEPPKGDPA